MELRYGPRELQLYMVVAADEACHHKLAQELMPMAKIRSSQNKKCTADRSSYLKELMQWRCHRDFHRAPHTYSSPKILSQKKRTPSNEMIKEKIQLKTPGTHYNLISHYLLGTLNITWISLCSTKPTSYSTEPTLLYLIQVETKLSCISDKCTRE